MLEFKEGVTLVGCGPKPKGALAAALARAPRLVCADGGADDLGGRAPDAVIGDGDSLADPEAWRARLGDRFLRLSGQDDTDFEKCLSHVKAPFFVAVGFLGGRIDHELAVLSAMIADRRPILAIGEDDVLAPVPAEIAFDAAPGDRISIFPLRETTVLRAVGLRWPAAGLTLAPGARIGTSNEATGGLVELAFAQPGALLIAPRAGFDKVLTALTA